MARLSSSICCALLAASCGGDDGGSTGPDAAPAEDAGDTSGCSTDADCDDGLFCTGTERCDPGASGANAFGCVAGTSPCPSSTVCDDDTDVCIDDCDTMGNLDGDGVDSRACGGDDCDDSNADVFGGNTEVCDVAGLDEDCDPATVGDRDADGDGHIDDACCNGDACGDDCDDANAGVHGDEAESCDGVDNDCDGATDEGVLSEYWVDGDGDGFGDGSMASMTACSAPSGWVENDTDCNDGDAGVHPGAAEICDRIDNDCSSGGGVVAAEDMDEDGFTATSYTGCGGGFPRTDCNDGDADVRPSQRAYFDAPACGAAGTCTCSDGGTSCTGAMSACRCDSATRTRVWDYDCDGSHTRAPSACTLVCSGALCSCSGPGAAYSGSPPCGRRVPRYASCSSLGACNPPSSTSGTAPVRCR